MEQERVIWMGDTREVDRQMAEEMFQVGILPCLPPPEEIVGNRYRMAGQWFMVTGPATKEEFLAAVEAAGVAGFGDIPPEYYFIRISTD